MEIISLNFLLFILVVIVVYYSLTRKAQNYWLFLTSVFFIYSWGWPNLILVFLIAGFTFLIGKRIFDTRKRSWLLVGISIIVTIFICYRILNSSFFNIFNQEALDASPDFIKQFLIPIGFSFYILQAISYLIDIYRSKIQPETSLIDFMVYLLFFPKILAGPIERPGSFLPQLKTGRMVDNQKLAQGFTLILLGLFRKIVIAEILLSIFPVNFIHAEVFNTHPSLGILSFPYFSYNETIPYLNRLIGIIAYGVYLYNDFAGYTQIMRGICLLMGINLSQNFRLPFFSTSLSDFWGRWHISLSSWLRDYLFFPLSRYLIKKTNGQFSILVIIIPFLSTMLISGFWHGLSVPLLLWGLTYGIVMILEQLFFQFWPRFRPQKQSKPIRILFGLLTFAIVSLAWVPFSAASIGEILAFWKVIIKGSGWNSSPSFDYWILILISLSFLLDFLQYKNKDDAFFIKWRLPARASAVAIAALALILAFAWTSLYDSTIFVYQNY
ncbi:MAG: MBOAT family protein [Anaerolineaceae bacterium]